MLVDKSFTKTNMMQNRIQIDISENRNGIYFAKLTNSQNLISVQNSF